MKEENHDKTYRSRIKEALGQVFLHSYWFEKVIVFGIRDRITVDPYGHLLRGQFDQ